MSNDLQCLTVSQRRVLRFLQQYVAQYEQSPTAKEIAQAIGIQSRGVVYRYLLALKTAGFIDLLPGRHRNIRLRMKTEPDAANRIQLLGVIAAGEPIAAIANPEELSSSDFTPPSDCFALRVKGDSMQDDGILDGDLVICRAVAQADNGAVVVALVDNENVTLKRIYYHGSDDVELKPANAKHQPLHLSAERVSVQGVLVKVIRSYA